MIIFTIIELRKKTDRYHEIILYREDIAPKEAISFSRDLAADTVTIRAEAFPHTLVLRFGTGVFSDEGVLHNNLERYFF